MIKMIMKFAALPFLMSVLAGCGGGNDSNTAEFKDGWITHSAGTQGACSSHGRLK
jgi:hypothetical protein